jgi:hypothetical protein
MRASLLGALAAAGLLVAVLLAGLPPLLVGGAGVLAVAFWGLAVGHAGAYVYHATRPAPVALGRPCCGQARAAHQALLQLPRRPLGRALVSLPAAFGLTQLAGVPRAAAQAGGTTVTRTFRKALGCPPCDGACVFEAFFTYTYRPLPGPGNRIQVTRFEMTWAQGDTGVCAASIDRGEGAFDFQCVGDAKPCQVTGGNIWGCPCDTTVAFVPLGTSTPEECTCPNSKNRTAYAQGRCGAPILVAKACDFQWIDINFRHKVTCTCATGGITRGDLVVVAQYRDGVLTFGGDIQN